MYILSFAGQRLSGKTTSANLVLEIVPQFRKLSFADSLRKMFSEKFEVPIEYLTNPMQKENYRNKMVEFADEEKKKNPRIFIDNFFSMIQDGELIVNDDIRFLEEYAAIVESGGKIYKVEANVKARKERGWVYNPFVDEHPSEKEIGSLPGHCFNGGVVWNSGTMEQLEEQITKILFS